MSEPYATEEQAAADTRIAPLFFQMRAGRPSQAKKAGKSGAQKRAIAEGGPR